MKNTLNPCKCNSGTGTGGSASDIVYDGLTVDCVPIAPGQNLAAILKNLGDYVCDLEGSQQNVTVNAGPPTGGSPGDIWFRQQGNVVSVYQNVDNSWVSRGDLLIGSAPTITKNDSVNYPATTSASLDSAYPGSSPGDIVWSETNSIRFEKMEAGYWSFTALSKA